jgi:hypothetical protein
MALTELNGLVARGWEMFSWLTNNKWNGVF